MEKYLLFGAITAGVILFGCDKKMTNRESLPINSGFEKGLTHWIVSQGSLDSTTLHSGKGALFIKNDTAHWSYAEQYIQIPPRAKKVIVSGWIKTEGVLPGKESWETALLNFEFVDTLFKHLDPYPQAAAELTGTNEWKEYRQTYEVMDSAYAIKLHMALGNATGKVWFDDISVRFSSAKGTEIPSQMIPESIVFSKKK